MNKKLIIGVLGFFVLVLLWSGASIYPDWLWFENLNFSSVFWTMLFSKVGFGLVIWVFLIVIISINLYAAKRLNTGSETTVAFKDESSYVSQLPLSGKAFNTIFLAIVLIISFVIASKGSLQWDMVLRYLYQEPFGGSDPIFDKDIGFYVFSLPFYRFIQNGVLMLFIFAGLIAISVYVKDGALQILDEFIQAEGKPISLPQITIAENAKKHLIFLGGIIVIILAWGYYLKIYTLLYSQQGPAFGASFTDITIKILPPIMPLRVTSRTERK